jgi:hypothetical protein
MVHPLAALRHVFAVAKWSAASLLLAAALGAAPPSGGLSDELRQELALPQAVPLEFVTIARGQDRHYSDAEAGRSAPNILRFEACHVGQRRLLFKITFARPPVFEKGGLLLYADLDCNPQTGRQDSRENRGVDVMVGIHGTQIEISYPNVVFNRKNTAVPAARIVGSVLYITLDAPLKIEAGKVRLDVSLLSERWGRQSDSTPRCVAEIPYFAERTVPPVVSQGVPDLRPLSDYRYHDNLAKYEKLADKGLTFEKVRPIRPMKIGRPCPPAPFAAASRKPGRPGSVKLQRVPVELLEEAGVARNPAAISFGFPLPQGAVFDLGNLRVLSPSGEEVPAQFTATSFWPDGSLKWVLIDFDAPLAAKQTASYAVEFGSAVQRRATDTLLKTEDSEGTLVVHTGPLKVAIDKRRFNLFHNVWRQGQPVAASGPEGVCLVDEHGKLFTTSGRAPDSVKIEEQGPRKLVVRVEGAYAAADGQTYMRYIARLIFRAGSARVTVALTHVDDYLQTEFTDITSLSLPLTLSGGSDSPRPLLGEGQGVREAASHRTSNSCIYLANADGAVAAHEGHSLRLFQTDERGGSLDVDGRTLPGGASPGLVECATPAAAVSAVIHDFWQRWPKGLSTDGRALRIELLPKQPGPDYGRGLPHYLLYPFVEGFYRFKWGMSFTERVSFDFGGGSARELLAEADMRVVAVLPAAWYARTKGLGLLAAPLGQQFALWDKYIAGGYASFVRRRADDRAFGYFNYGDWYGERGRNWGNNEYDFAHCFFMQFARTGNRDYFRVALPAARHQADVDCIHAYPDPYYLGGNLPHSIGHTGNWSERPLHGTWSHAYDGMAAASNGHTWTTGMVDAWHLAGDARAMEGAIGVGEHITWAMSRDFKTLGTHERSAGWSLKAILSLYRSTYDPLYLEAARRIAAVALREQKFNDGGAWPHPLPEDHAGGHADARGNAIFLIGIVLEGLKEFHEETHDPALPRSLEAGARWLLKCWNADVEGWPYTALVSGEPLFPAEIGANGMVASSLAYVGLLTGEEQFIQVAATALGALARNGSGGDGKSIAQQMNFSSDTLALLQQWYAVHRSDRGAEVMTGTGADLAQYLAKTRDAKEHSVREPLQKIFFVRLRSPAAATHAPPILLAVRKPHGAMFRRAEFGTIQVFDSAAAEVRQARFDTDDPYRFECPLNGRPGDVFKVVITDDLRSVWSLFDAATQKSGSALSIMMQTGPGFAIGGVGRSRYHFLVPEGTREFRVKIRAGHHGPYAGLVIAPSGQIAGFHQGVNLGSAAPVSGAAKAKTAAANAHPERGVIRVNPDPRETGKVWSLVLTAAGDIYCELEGVPPYLSLTADVWPQKGKE